MARPRAFDQDAALLAALDVFHNKGYEAASMDNLVQAMGIGRQSLYNTYGDKHALFLQTVETQVNKYANLMSEHFLTEHPFRESMQLWFDQYIHKNSFEKRRGCLIINTAMELADRDLQAADLVARSQRGQENILYQSLTNARERGELPQDFDCLTFARYLVGCLNGMIVLAKADPSSPSLVAMSQLALTGLPTSTSS